MRDEIRLNSRRAIVLYIAGATFCFASFLCGLLIGRSPMAQSQAAEKWVSAGSVTAPEATPASEQPVGEENPGSQSDPAHMSNPPNSELVAGPLAEQPPVRELESYLVRVASVSSALEAEKFVANLRRRGFENAFLREARSASGERLFYVFLGPYPDREWASRAVRELRLSGISEAEVVPDR